MANTGYKQATVAYKVSKPGGEPLDIDGELISVSGKKQAIAVLQGYTNPDPNKYEIERYFDVREMIAGRETVIYDSTSCPIEVNPIYPDKYEDLPKNKADILFKIDAMGDNQMAAVSIYDYDRWLENEDSPYETGVGRYYDLWNDVSEDRGRYMQGTYPIIDCDEFTFFSKRVKNHPGRNSMISWGSFSQMDVKQSDLDGERFFQSRQCTIKEFDDLYGSYLASGNGELRGMFNASKIQVYKQGNIVSGWGLPTHAEILQLIGQMPKYNYKAEGTKISLMKDIQDFFLMDSTNVKLANTGVRKDFSGLGMLFGGIVQNADDFTTTVLPCRCYGFNSMSAFLTMPNTKSDNWPSITLITGENTPVYEDNSFVLKIEVSPNVYLAHGANVMYSRIKTDEELGYKLIIDRSTDEVLFKDTNFNVDFENIGQPTFDEYYDEWAIKGSSNKAWWSNMGEKHFYSDQSKIQGKKIKYITANIPHSGKLTVGATSTNPAETTDHTIVWSKQIDVAGKIQEEIEVDYLLGKNEYFFIGDNTDSTRIFVEQYAPAEERPTFYRQPVNGTTPITNQDICMGIMIEQVKKLNRYEEMPKGLERGVALYYANRKHRVVLKPYSEIQKETAEYKALLEV